jgi:hypothetical protein
MATTAGHRLTLNPMGKCSNAFFSETTNMIKAKLYMNVHWMVLYKLYVFCSDMKFKMAAIAGLSLTLDPMGKMFQNASSLKPLGTVETKLPRNDHWKVLCFLCRSEIQDGHHHRTIWGKYRNIFFSESIALIEPKLHQSLEGPLQTLCFSC